MHTFCLISCTHTHTHTLPASHCTISWNFLCSSAAFITACCLAPTSAGFPSWSPMYITFTANKHPWWSNIIWPTTVWQIQIKALQFHYTTHMTPTVTSPSHKCTECLQAIANLTLLPSITLFTYVDLPLNTHITCPERRCIHTFIRWFLHCMRHVLWPNGLGCLHYTAVLNSLHWRRSPIDRNGERAIDCLLLCISFICLCESVVQGSTKNCPARMHCKH